jgi:hypothetical protein
VAAKDDSASDDKSKDDKSKDDKSKDDKSKDGKSKDGGKQGSNTSGATPTAPAPTTTTTTPGAATAPSTGNVPTGPAPAAVGGAPGISSKPARASGVPTSEVALGTSVGVATAQGAVVIRTSEGREVETLPAATAVPVGTHVDARFGTVELTSAVDADGTMQTATFSGGIFEVTQPSAGHGITRVELLGGKWGVCHAQAATRRGGATTARTQKAIRSLWGSDNKGRFETRGRNSVATVRGTRWLTEEFCDGTRTTVRDGAVVVRDLTTGKSTMVKAGHSYFARLATK